MPVLDSYKEVPKFRACHSLEEIFKVSEKAEEIPPLSLLRCTFEDLEVKKEKVITTELIFQTLSARYAWIGLEEGEEYAVSNLCTYS